MNLRRIFVFMALILAMPAHFAVAEMSSTNYQIEADTLSTGGSDTGTSTSYQLRDTIGGMGADQMNSGSYKLDSEYRAQIYDRISNFEVFLQNSASEVAVTDLTDNSITVTSTTGYTEGDRVLLVQNKGGSQQTAIGTVESVGATIDVDFLSHVLTIDGSDDYLYKLNGSALSFGQLSKNRVSTAAIGWEVTADVDNGYQVLVFEDGDFTNGSSIITDVSDGEVTAGVSEFGARSSDDNLIDSLFDTQDVGITQSSQQVGSSESGVFKDRDALTIKASYESGQSSGSYSNTVNIVYVGSY